jgi:hypothetical protein
MQTLLRQRPYLYGIIGRGTWSAMRLPTFARVGHARFDVLTDHIPFALRKDCKDVGEGAPCWRRERPAGVVRSRASVNKTNPTPKAVRSCNVVIKSTSERPQQSSFHTRMKSSLHCDAGW